MWVVRAPPGYGTVVHVQRISMRNASHFLIYNLAEQKEVAHWSIGNYHFPISVIKGGATFAVRTSAQKPEKGEEYSSFNVSYEVHPMSQLPQELEAPTETTMVSSKGMFNCSSGAVPTALACDGVQHCAGEEDEEGCDYRQQGCGTWVPYNDQCLKVEFAVLHFSHSGGTRVTAPSEAEKACQKKYGATLAALPDKRGMKVMEHLVYQSGFSSVAVNLHKIKPVSEKQEFLYRYLWQWGSKGSPVDYDHEDLQKQGTAYDCAMLEIFPSPHFTPVRCLLPYRFPHGYACMRPHPTKSRTHPKLVLHLENSTRPITQFPTKSCPDGSMVQLFHQCRWQGKALSSAWSPHGFRLFYCQYGPSVHYSLLCDGLEDCADGSDETGCLFPHNLKKNDSLFICGNLQVIAHSKRCDGVVDCFDKTDEECTACRNSYCWGAGCVPTGYVDYFESCTDIILQSTSGTVGNVLVPPSETYPSLRLDGHGMSSFYVALHEMEGHFQCGSGIYLPTFFLNNGERDCPEGEDENILPESFTCPGYYRCQQYGNCVYFDFVCDGVPHCPNKDDEIYCELNHPSNCTCEGYACSCLTLSPSMSDFWYLRYLDLSGVKQPPISQLLALDFLQFLNVSFCQLSKVLLTELPQVRVLDLSHNALSGLSSMRMKNLSRLTHLNISGNPLVAHLDSAFPTFLSQAGLINLRHLAMTHTLLRHIQGRSFSSLVHLVSLDIRNNELEDYDKRVLEGLRSIQVLQTDDPRLCCSYFHPKELDCFAPTDELSSCTDLLGVDFFRVFLWTVSFLTVLGNCGVLLYKVIKKGGKRTAYHVLVKNLCMADLLMGVYMIIIGVADVYFRDNYVANDRQWKESKTCLVAGLLAFVSSEMSAFSISLITLDRLLTLCFPFKPHLHLTAASSLKLVCAVWGLVILLATVPLMGQLEFYGESSICLPLPITRHQFSGQLYSFFVFIVMNFALFVFIGTGQLAIYWAVQKTKSAANTKSQEEDSTIAQRLFLVVFTDFCCWFPVGLMGLLAFSGTPIPGVVSVWTAVFVLPLNSALNPFLYTLNNLREKWNATKVNRQTKRILSNLKKEFPKLPADMAEELMLLYLGSNKAAKLDKISKVITHKMKNERDAGK